MSTASEADKIEAEIARIEARIGRAHQQLESANRRLHRARLLDPAVRNVVVSSWRGSPVGELCYVGKLKVQVRFFQRDIRRLAIGSAGGICEFDLSDVAIAKDQEPLSHERPGGFEPDETETETKGENDA